VTGLSRTGDETRIRLSSEKPVKCLTLGLESWREGDDEVEFTDNAVSRRQLEGSRRDMY
jgi:hypothetical protein